MDDGGAGRSPSCLRRLHTANQMSQTTKLRWVFSTLWVVSVVVALIGWTFFDRDPAQLAPVIGWITAAVATGEASNIGKRATFKSEAQ